MILHYFAQLFILFILKNCYSSGNNSILIAIKISKNIQQIFSPPPLREKEKEIEREINFNFNHHPSRRANMRKYRGSRSWYSRILYS